jgi:hypothetical protein
MASIGKEKHLIYNDGEMHTNYLTGQPGQSVNECLLTRNKPAPVAGMRRLRSDLEAIMICRQFV